MVGNIRGTVREMANYSSREGNVEAREGEERRVREINCPRLCPHPVVCLHQSSAERADRTGGEEGSEEEEEEEGGCASRWRRKGE